MQVQQSGLADTVIKRLKYIASLSLYNFLVLIIYKCLEYFAFHFCCLGFEELLEFSG